MDLTGCTVKYLESYVANLFFWFALVLVFLLFSWYGVWCHEQWTLCAITFAFSVRGHSNYCWSTVCGNFKHIIHKIKNLRKCYIKCYDKLKLIYYLLSHYLRYLTLLELITKTLWFNIIYKMLCLL